jgi:hypothetical protein
LPLPNKIAIITAQAEFVHAAEVVHAAEDERAAATRMVADILRLLGFAE